MHKKDELIEIVSHDVIEMVKHTSFDKRTLHYRVLKVSEVYSSLGMVEYQAQLVYDQNIQENPVTNPSVYYSHYHTEQGVWYSETENNIGIKAFSLNALFLHLSALMKEEDTQDVAQQNFLAILSLVTFFREACVAGLEA